MKSKVYGSLKKKIIVKLIKVRMQIKKQVRNNRRSNDLLGVRKFPPSSPRKE
jgi:hypothetical protein